MNIIKIGELKTVMSNPESKHNYFAWPTVTRLQNGKLALVSSGYRIWHICPFGKAVISYSEDEGESYTMPAPVIDTVLDDRDAGICTFGKSGVIVTSFNNKVAFQRKHENNYSKGYLDSITPEEEKRDYGATFRISNDCGVTFGKLYKSPVTSPHGPIELNDGSLLWVGRAFVPYDGEGVKKDYIQAYKINPDGECEFLGKIPDVISEKNLQSHEPHAICLPDGRILVHIRVEDCLEEINIRHNVFTIYQSESLDGGKTWTAPVQVLDDLGGAPAHLMLHSSGVLICSYGYRQKPYGIKVMFSKDYGKTWDSGYDINVNDVSVDIGYPATVELEDKSLLTVFYAHNSDEEPAVIMQQKWKFEE